MTSKLKTILIVSIGVLVVTVVVFFVFFYKATLKINVNPSSAQIEIAGQKSVGSLKTKLKPGNYDLVITHPDYIKLEENIGLKMSQVADLNLTLIQSPEPYLLVDYPAHFATLTYDQGSIIYLSNQGRTVYRVDEVDLDSKSVPRAITAEDFSDVKDMIWFPNKKLALVKQADRNTLYDFSRYDLLHHDSKELDKLIKNIAIDPTGEKIIYFFEPGTGEKSLVRAYKDNSQPEKLIDLREYNLTNPQLDWSSDGKKILLVTDQIYLYDLYSKSISQLTQFESVSDAQFTPDGQSIIYQQDGALYLMDLAGGNKKNLDIKTSFNKLAWVDDQNFICAIKEEGKEVLIKYNLDSGDKLVYNYSSKENIDFSHLFLAENRSKIFFNSGDYLYSLKLVSGKY